MANMMRRRVQAAGMVLAAVLMTGCAAFVAGSAVGVGGAVAYVNGELRQVVEADSLAVRDAVAKAAERLELKVLETHADGLSGRFLMETGKDEEVRIRYERLDERHTTLFIRVGLIGDRRASQVVLEEIVKGL